MHLGRMMTWWVTVTFPKNTLVFHIFTPVQIERLTEKNLELSSQLQSSTSALEDMEQFKDVSVFLAICMHILAFMAKHPQLAEEMERQHVEYEEQLKGDVASLTIRCVFALPVS